MNDNAWLAVAICIALLGITLTLMGIGVGISSGLERIANQCTQSIVK